MTRDEFVRYVLDGGKGAPSKKSAKTPQPVAAALPGGFTSKFAAAAVAAAAPAEETSGPAKSFAEKLLRGCGFGEPETLDRDLVILGDSAAAKYLPKKVLYWEKSLPERDYQVLLFEAEQRWGDIKGEAFFKGRRFEHLDLLEDALTRLAKEALEGFEHGGQGRTADKKRGRKDETLCIVSFVDDREPEKDTRLLCLASFNATHESLEVFFIRESCRFWERQLAEEHLGTLFERQFKKLTTPKWHEAFTTEDERKLARDLVKECEGGEITEKKLANRVIGLLDEIAKGFGLKKNANEDRRLSLTKLPDDHDIGADPEAEGGTNPFAGMSVRDEKRRLLGYIVYCLTKKKDADALRARLAAHNRFHNVLVVYPSEDHATFELWQGRDRLEGKLTKKGVKFAGEAEVISLLSRFFVVSRAKVKNPAELAEELASRAKYLRRLAHKQLEKEATKGHLRDLYKAFTEALIHDMSEDSFTDAFAQTLTYGLLTARWLSREELEQSGERFTRETALKHLPSTSPFLREFFEQALDASFAPNLVWLLEDIAELLDRVNIDEVFGRGDEGSDVSTDPVIHFYEPFLAAYDPEQRQKRGVYYTPRPVVSYIVRGVDELLKTDLGIEEGLASTMTWKDVLAKHPGVKKPDGVAWSDPFIRILDPATGTGTFLVMCIEVIEKSVKEAAAKALGDVSTDATEVGTVWQHYVKKQLLPRLYGFELMIAPYAIAHLKIGLKLRESGAVLGPNDRLNVFLTNSLEPHADFSGHLAFDVPALASEARTVGAIKQTGVFTVVVGNPPYAGHSLNNEVEWIVNKTHDYKHGFPELQKPGQAKWLQDDYVKFIRLAEHYLSMAPLGAMGMITNHSYLDNPTFKGMRRHLRDTFRHLLIVDLHGSTKKKERTAEGTPDENVFDIQQGVAITFGSRGGGSNLVELVDLYETRAAKYEWLSGSSLESSYARPISANEPLYLFRAQDDSLGSEYRTFLALDKCMSLNGDPAPGIVTTHDEFAVSWSRTEAIEKVELLLATKSETEARSHFTLCSQDQWNYSRAKKALADGSWRNEVIRILYRPFDWRWTVFNSNVAVHRRERVMRHMLDLSNIGIICTRQTKDQWGAFVTSDVCGHKTCGAYDINYLFPLNLLPTEGDLVGSTSPRKNISPLAEAAFSKALSESRNGAGTTPVTPDQIFHYFYGVFHSPGYRKRYADFLKTDFPRVPVPRRRELFDALTLAGKRLVDLHLLRSATIGSSLVEFFGETSPFVEKPSYSHATIWLDKKRTAGFRGVAEAVWSFHVGGYQPCEKWLKDRKGRNLTTDEVEHFIGVVSAIAQTLQLMAEIDDAIEAEGGWPSAFVESDS